jgi:hypothetical protein
LRILTFDFLVSKSISFVLPTNDDIWARTWHLTISSFKTCKHFIKRSTLIIHNDLNYHYFSIKIRHVTLTLEDEIPPINTISRLKMNQNLKRYGEITRCSIKSVEFNKKSNNESKTSSTWSMRRVYTKRYNRGSFSINNLISMLIHISMQNIYSTNSIFSIILYPTTNCILIITNKKATNMLYKIQNHHELYLELSCIWKSFIHEGSHVFILYPMKDRKA